MDLHLADFLEIAPPPPQGTLVTTSARAIFFTGWLNILLITSETTLALFYLVYNRLNLRTKAVILGVLLIDWFVNQKKAEWAFTWHTSVVYICSNLVAAFEQAAFLHYHWSLNRNIPIAIGAIVLLVARVLFSIVSNVYVVVDIKNGPRRDFGIYAGLIAAVLLAAADIWIVILFVWRRNMTFKPIPRSTWRGKVWYIVIYTITHGLVTLTMSILWLIFYFVDILGYHALSSLMGRIYALTLIITYITNREGQEPPRSAATTPLRNIPVHSTRVTGIEFTSISRMDLHTLEDINEDNEVQLRRSQSTGFVSSNDSRTKT